MWIAVGYGLKPNLSKINCGLGIAAGVYYSFFRIDGLICGVSN
jgi:hypothetical protein